MESQRCLRCGICSECYQCVKACLAKAIDHAQEPEIVEIPVGSVILCPGLRPLRSLGVRDSTLPHEPERGHQPRVRAHPERFRAHHGAPRAASRPQGAQEDRLAPVRRLARQQPVRQRLLLVGLLHVRHEGGHGRQGARARRSGVQPSSTWTCAPSARTSRNTTTGPSDKHGVRFMRSRVHYGGPCRRRETCSLRYVNEAGGMQFERVRHGRALGRAADPPGDGRSWPSGWGSN